MSVKIWIEASHQPAYRAGGFAWLRHSGEAVSGELLAYGAVLTDLLSGGSALSLRINPTCTSPLPTIFTTSELQADVTRNSTCGCSFLKAERMSGRMKLMQ